ncbi:MAG: porin family protein [Chitinophagaceae bacterium]
MKKQLQTGLILSMMFLSANTFGQTTGSRSDAIKNGNEKAKTYVAILFKLVNTDLNYGSSNSALADSKKSLPGVQVGASFQAGITPALSLVPELYFITKGGRLTENKSLNISQTKLRLYTVEFPVLARVDIGKVYLNAGPSIAYNLSGTSKIDDVSKALSFDNSSEGFKRWDAGIQMGAGYRFKIKQKPVALDIRYSYGLTNISHGEEIHNRYLNIGLYVTRPWKTNRPGRKGNS